MSRHWNLRRKLVLISASSLLTVCGILFWLNYRATVESTRREYVARARSLVLTTESIREEMARKWHLGLFDQKQLNQWGRQGERDKVLAAVPVVTAWKAAIAKSKEGGYEFRVPKFRPRNAKNTPDEVEARVLRQFEVNPQLTEYFEVDPTLNAVRYFHPIRLTQECTLCHGDPARSQELWGNERGMDPTGGPMENWKEGEVHGAFEVVQSLDEADALAAATLRDQAVLVLGLVILVGGIVFLLVARWITRPIRETVAAFKRFAAGDLTRPLAIGSSDEMGELRGAANSLMDKLRAMIRQMDHCAAELMDSSSSLQASADQLAGMADQTTHQSSSVAAAAEQMAVNMQNMAGSTEQMSTNVRTVTLSVEQMTATIAEVARSAEQTASVADGAARLAQTSNERIGQLDQAASEIGAVIELIQDIAEQTNLLALNATIEAARAGEAGKGFTVVATEVKQLARQSAEATEDIRARIEAIQRSAEEAIRAITEIGDVVGQVNGASRTIASAVEEQSITTREIARNVAEASSSAQTVAVGIAETAAAAREVTRSIAYVDSNAKQTATDAGHTQAAGGHLARLAGQLHELVQQFQTN
jgi:methyl-accepting chemotaxis protein